METAVAYSTICVSNMDKALEFYRDTIGMRIKSDTKLNGECYDKLYLLRGMDARRVVLGFQGSGEIHLVQHYAHRGWPVSKTINQYDYCFIHLGTASHSINEIYQEFQQKGVQINCPVQTNSARQNKCFSFKGPDYVQLETQDWWVKHPWLKVEPQGKGFYALVHSSLSVSDLNKTLHLYRGILGMSLIRESHLEGDRFEAVDCLGKGAIAKNTVVRGNEGTEIQILWHYAGAYNMRGKPIGATMQQCDYAIVNIGLKTDDIAVLHKLLKKEGVVVNCDIQVTPDRTRAFSFRDPDGNFLIVQS